MTTGEKDYLTGFSDTLHPFHLNDDVIIISHCVLGQNAGTVLLGSLLFFILLDNLLTLLRAASVF